MIRQFSNMKIAVTDQTHRDGICQILNDLGYQSGHTKVQEATHILTTEHGTYFPVFWNNTTQEFWKETNFQDLLKIRDETIKSVIKEV